MILPTLVPSFPPRVPGPRGRSPRAALAGAALAVAVAASGAASAQSGSGLRLGEPAPEPTLDLGVGSAPEAADAPVAPAAPSAGAGAERAGSATGAGGGATPTPANAVRTTYGDWEVACAPAGSEGGCAMAQIGNDATGTPVLEMVIRKLAEPLEVNEQTAVAVLDVITPLGVVLTEGLSMQIDGGREESAAFQICTEQGCLVREPVGEELIARLQRGRVAKISVFAAVQGEVVSDISLQGFTKAYAETR